VRLLPRRAPKIDKLQKAGDVEGLRAALDYSDASASEDGAVWALPAPARAEAAAALATFDGAVVEDGLAHALTDPDARVRETALDRISQRSSPVAVDGLLDGVVGWPYPDGYEPLEKALATLVGWAPAGIAEAYVRKLLEPDAPELDERHEDALGALTGADPAGEAAETRVTDLLVAELDEPQTRAQAERIHRILGWLGDSGADAVLRRLESGVGGPAVVRAAGSIQDSRAVEPLIAMMGSSEPKTRAAAAKALGQLNDTRAVQALTAATQDPSHVVRAAASEALNTMGVAAVIVGVATVMRETLRELGEGDAAPAAVPETLPASVASTLPPVEAPPQARPTWAQEALARLLKRTGG
jgi:HEAT repeat protein